MMEAVEGQFDIEKIQNYIIGLGAGGALGFMTGAAIKHTAKRVAIALGTLFILLQVFQFVGFIDVRWDKVTQSALPVFDANEDGVLDEDDAKYMMAHALKMAPEILAKGLPNVAGFTTGMALAFWFL